MTWVYLPVDEHRAFAGELTRVRKMLASLLAHWNQHLSRKRHVQMATESKEFINSRMPKANGQKPLVADWFVPMCHSVLASNSQNRER
jgi:hypothetical protein